MPGDGHAIVVEARTHQIFGWILIPVEAYGDQVLRMVLDTRLLDSFISEPIRNRLLNLGVLQEAGRDRYILSSLKIADSSVPNMAVRTYPGLVWAGTEGSIGLRYLSFFDEIRFERASRRLTLVDP